jgi:hypothetical protein
LSRTATRTRDNARRHTVGIAIEQRG